MRKSSRLLLIAFALWGGQCLAQADCRTSGQPNCRTESSISRSTFGEPATRSVTSQLPTSGADETSFDSAIRHLGSSPILLADAGTPDLPGTLRARLEDSTKLEPQPLPAFRSLHAVSSRACADEQASPRDCREHWAPLLRQTFEFLLIQAGGNIAFDKNMRYNTFHGHWAQHWFDAASNMEITHWNDGDSALASYVSHPMMGSVTDFLYIQNDPKGRDLGFQNTRAYWMSRLRATMFSTVYAAEWKVGPISEAAVGNTGRYVYYSKASHGLTNGTGAVDFVITPLGGTVWSIGEDLIDRQVIWRLEGKTNNKAALLGFSVLNPTRSLANLLRGKAPWYRDYRETRLAHYAAPFHNLPADSAGQ